MALRSKIKQSTAKRLFTKHALQTNHKNVAPPPMRGGYRI